MTKRAFILSTLAATVLAITGTANPVSAVPVAGATAVGNAVSSSAEVVQLSRRWWLPYYYYGGPSYPPAGTRCARQYPSYDPVTSTFIGRDGLRHFCP
jgi:hypothetical protein